MGKFATLFESAVLPGHHFHQRDTESLELMVKAHKKGNIGSLETAQDGKDAEKILDARYYGKAKAPSKTGFDHQNESTEVNEAGLRKISQYEQGRHKATIHRDADWNEYRVKFHEDGVHHEPSDHHTDDKQDAMDTAKSQVDKNHAKDLAAKAA